MIILTLIVLTASVVISASLIDQANKLQAIILKNKKGE